MIRKSINNPDDYEFKAYDSCMIKGCENPAQWFLREGIGMCDKHYKELEVENEKKH